MSSIIIRIITIVPQELFWNEITVMRTSLEPYFKPIYQLQISKYVYNNILLPFD